MKYTFSEMQDFYAQKRGFESFAAMSDAGLQSSAKVLMNNLLDLIWFFKGGWGFNNTKYAITFQAPVQVTVSATAGQRVVTLGTTQAASSNGVPIVGQVLVVNNRPYRIINRRSGTVLNIDSGATEAWSGTAGTIYFYEYPTPYNVGAVKFIEVPYSEEPLSYYPESLTSLGVQGAVPECGYDAGRNEQDFYNTGTLAVTNGSNLFTLSGGTESLEHIGMSLLLKVSSAYQWFIVVDVDTTGHTFTVDRVYTGSNTSGLSYALNPKGIQKIGFKPYPLAAERVKIAYTFACDKLVNATDLTQLPDDTPMMVGIELLGTKWETIGSMSNINEVVFTDKKFKESLKILNFRNTPLQNRLYSLSDIRHRYFPRSSNPWNSPGYGR